MNDQPLFSVEYQRSNDYLKGMEMKTIYRVLRFSLLGAAAAVMVSGTFGLDAHLPDAMAALLGGAAAGAISKFAVLT